MRVSLVIDGDAVPFDPEYPEEFERAAGSQFVERKDGVAWVRTQGGVVMAVYEGWAAVRPGGGADGQAYFITPEILAAGKAQAAV